MRILTFLLYTCLLFLACNQDPEPDPFGFILTEADFGTSEFTRYDLVGAEEAIDMLVGVGHYIYYATYGREIRVFDTQQSETLPLLANVRITALQVFADRVYICSDAGMYRIDPDRPTEPLRIGTTCYDVEVIDDEVFFTSFEQDSVQDFPNRLFRLDAGSSRRASELLPDLIGSILPAPGNEIMAVSASGGLAIYRFDLAGNLLDTYESEEHMIPERIADVRLQPVSNGAELFIVGKQGFGYPSVVRWSAETNSWTNLLIPEVLEAGAPEGDQKLVFLQRATVTDAVVSGDGLYITTTAAGCHGLFRFDLAGAEPFEYVDFQVIQDARLGTDQCLEGMFIDGRIGTVYLYGQQSAFRFM